jgi:hypothetical protein
LTNTHVDKTGTAAAELANPRLSRSHQENTSALSNLIALDKTIAAEPTEIQIFDHD